MALATRDFVGQIVDFSTVLPDYNERGMRETVAVPTIS